MNNTYVGNVVDAILLAMENEAAVGEVFNIRDERPVNRVEFVGTVAEYLNRPAPRHVPEWLAKAAVGLFEGVGRLTGSQRAPLLTRTRLKFLTLNLEFSIEKAKRVLGYQPRVDFREGIYEGLDWLASQGLIPDNQLRDRTGKSAAEPHP